MNMNRVLCLDIETAPMLAYIFDLKTEYVHPENIKEDWYVLAWAAKWVGDPASKMIYGDQSRSKDIKNDKKLLYNLWLLLNEADVVLTQNGRKFDHKKLNARFMIHGFKPPKPFQHFDTYQLVSKVASFTSNGLDYLTKTLNKKYTKLSHKKYPGLKLWKECMARNMDAWKEMEKYNIHDVLSTEELYLNIRAWAPDSFPKVYDYTNSATQCGTCGYEGSMIVGKERKAKNYTYEQNSCPKCGSWQKGFKVKRG